MKYAVHIDAGQGEYRYRVVSTQVVGPYDVAVLDPSGNEIRTLVTCYPFYFVGAAPTGLSFGPKGSPECAWR